MTRRNGANGKPGTRPRSSRGPLILLGILLALLLGVNPLMARKAEVDELGARLQEEKEALEELRTRAAALAQLEAKLRELEAEYAKIPWPPDPATAGVAWIDEILRRAGWEVESVEVFGGEVSPSGVKETKITVKGKAKGAKAVLQVLRELLEARASLKRVLVEADPKGGLRVLVDIAVLTPKEVRRGER